VGATRVSFHVSDLKVNYKSMVTFVGGERRNPHNSRSGEILIVKHFGRCSPLVVV
jgi:hypothetical protein